MPITNVLRDDPSIRWVVFDAAGTLIHLPSGAADVYAAVGREFGLNVSADYIESRFTTAYAVGFDDGLQPTSEADQRQRWLAVVRHCFADISTDPTKIVNIFNCLWERFSQLTTWRLDGDADKVFCELQNQQIGIAIASNFDSRLKSIIRESPVLSICHQLFLSSEIGFNKPHANFYQHVFASLQRSSKDLLRPSEILMVGDSLINDVKGAIDVGWQALHYCGNHPISGRPMSGDNATMNHPKISRLMEIFG